MCPWVDLDCLALKESLWRSQFPVPTLEPLLTLQRGSWRSLDTLGNGHLPNLIPKTCAKPCGITAAWLWGGSQAIRRCPRCPRYQLRAWWKPEAARSKISLNVSFVRNRQARAPVTSTVARNHQTPTRDVLCLFASGSFRWHHPPALVPRRSPSPLVFTPQKEENSFITGRQ